MTSSEQTATVRELFGSPEPPPAAKRLLGPLVDAAVRLHSRPWEHGALTPKERALILLCLDATSSQLEPARLPQRVADARDNGATDREIVAVLQLTSLIGCHSVSVGAPILWEVLRERGEVSDGDLTPDQADVVRRFETGGPWPRTMSDRHRAVMEADTEYFVRLQEYINQAHSATDVMSSRMMHLVCIAIDAAPTHLYQPGLRIHIKEALDQGATAAEVAEVLQLASMRGWRSVLAGLEALTS